MTAVAPDVPSAPLPAEAVERPARAKLPHRPALDGLRGIAVVGVLLFHAGYLKGGYLGVDLFFVLSGYLITSLLLVEHRSSGGVALGAFWGRRFRRLLPAVLALLLFICVYALTIARPVDLGQIRGDGLATLYYVANWHTIRQGTSYWDLALAPSPLQHTWSLSIEEQFYLVWPFLVAVVATRAKRPAEAVLRVAAFGAAFSVLVLLVLYHDHASFTRMYEGTDTRAVALLLGAALAAWRMLPSNRRQQRTLEARANLEPAKRWAAMTDGDRGIETAVAASILVLAAMWLWFGGTSAWLYKGGLPVASLLALVVVAGASRPWSPVAGWCFSRWPLRKLGLISYGLYLWHWPIYVILDTKNGQIWFLGDRYLHGLWMLGVKLALSLGAALLSYKFIEAPIRFGTSKKPWGVVGAVGGIAFVTVALLVATAGAVDAPGPQDAPEGAAVQVPGAPKVLFGGDSVTVSLASRILKDPARFGINPYEGAQVGCSIAYAGYDHHNTDGKPGTIPPSCADKVLGQLQGVQPDVVFFMTGARPNDYAKVDGSYVRACDPAFDDAYRSSLTDLVRKLQATGAPVVLGTVLHSSSNAFSYEGSEERIDCMNDVVRSVAKAVPDTSVVDLNELVCPKAPTCVEELDGAPVRSEGLHFDAGAGGDAVATWTLDRILAAAKLEAKPTAGTTSTTAAGG